MMDKQVKKIGTGFTSYHKKDGGVIICMSNATTNGLVHSTHAHT